MMDSPEARALAAEPWLFGRQGLGLLALVMAIAATFLATDITYLAGALLLVGLAARAWAALAFARVSYTRRTSRVRAFCGDEVALESTLANPRPLPLPWVEVWEHLPAALAPAGASERSFVDPNRMWLSRGVAIWPYQRLKWSRKLVCSHRGAFRMGQITLRTGDPFGFFERERHLQDTLELLVYPRVVPLRHLGLPLHHPALDVVGPNSPIADPTRTATVRDYRPGDPQRLIHWPTTARRGSLQGRARTASRRDGGAGPDGYYPRPGAVHRAAAGCGAHGRCAPGDGPCRLDPSLVGADHARLRPGRPTRVSRMNTRVVDPRTLWAVLAMELAVALPIVSLPTQGDRLPGLLGPVLLVALLPLGLLAMHLLPKLRDPSWRLLIGLGLALLTRAVVSVVPAAGLPGLATWLARSLVPVAIGVGLWWRGGALSVAEITPAEVRTEFSVLAVCLLLVLAVVRPFVLADPTLLGAYVAVFARRGLVGMALSRQDAAEVVALSYGRALAATTAVLPAVSAVALVSVLRPELLGAMWLTLARIIELMLMPIGLLLAWLASLLPRGAPGPPPTPHPRPTPDLA